MSVVLTPHTNLRYQWVRAGGGRERYDGGLLCLIDFSMMEKLFASLWKIKVVWNKTTNKWETIARTKRNKTRQVVVVGESCALCPWVNICSHTDTERLGLVSWNWISVRPAYMTCTNNYKLTVYFVFFCVWKKLNHLLAEKFLIKTSLILVKKVVIEIDWMNCGGFTVTEIKNGNSARTRIGFRFVRHSIQSLV